MASKERRPRVSNRSPEVIRGVSKYSRLKKYLKRGLSAIKANHNNIFLTHDPKPAEPKPEEKVSQYYPTNDVMKRLANNRKHKSTKLRTSITLGTVLILFPGN